MRLNLGCGRATLPTDKDGQYTKHLIYLPDSAMDSTVKWVNVDKRALSGVDECVDLFSYPWVRSSNGNPWNDSVAEEIWASHIVEHIPHAAKYAPCANATVKDQGLLDGWYAWFYEAWRILQPGGILHITTPLAFSRSALADPTHTRYILPQTFGYLSPNDESPFDYQIAARFEQDGPVMARVSSDIVEKLENGSITEDDIPGLSSNLNNIFEEMYICLRAVK